MRLTDLTGRSVAVWGTGREGVSAVRAVAKLQPATLIAVDEKPPRDPAGWRDVAGEIPLHIGSAGLDALLGADVVIKSPGVPLVHPWLARLANAGVTITSGTALWMAEHAPHTIAVTGTKGKSTTSALIHHLLVALGHDANFAGNIGTPLLGAPESEWHVVELSSQQCQSLTTSPSRVVLTSLFPEHLDWHGSEERYYQDKLNIIAHDPKTVVINAFDNRLAGRVAALRPAAPIIEANTPDGFHLSDESTGEPYFYRGQTPLFPRRVFPLLGQHNARNLCLALTLLAELGIDCAGESDRIGAAVAHFQGLDHRLQRVPDPAGRVVFVNDSLSTAPQSAIAALESFDSAPVTLIVGGTDRGLDYGVLRDYLAETRKAPTVVLAIPDSGPRIAAELRRVAGLTVEVVADLSEAVSRARELTPPEGVVLLSPAAPSYGKFTDHAHRAAVFAQAIAETATNPGQSRTRASTRDS